MQTIKRALMPTVSVAALVAGRPAGVLGAPRGDAGAGSVEKLLGEVKAELERISSDVKKTAEDALKQAKNAGDVSAETKKKADDLLQGQTQLTAAQEKLTAKLEELSTRATDVEQKMAARGRSGGEQRKSPGQIFVEHDDYKAFIAKGARGSARITINQAITSATGSAGDLIVPDREREIVRMPRRQLLIRQLLTQGRTTSNMVEYPKQTTRTNNADVVSEGAEKPESSYEWGKADAPVRTIAHWVHVSRQAAADAAQLQTEIDSELRYGLDLKEETEILTGDGTGEHLSGLITEATAYSAAFAVTGETEIDKLRLAILQASLAEFPASGIVLHPTDWARIELTKDGELRYLFANPVIQAAPSLWSLPVVATQSLSVDKFLVGAFAAAATIYDREDTEVLISSEDRDNFIKNMLTVRAEKRLAMAVKRPLALTYGDFGNV